VTSSDRNFLFMIVLGVLSIVFRRTLVRWGNEMRYDIFRVPMPGPRRQHAYEILQLLLGVFFVLFGVMGLLFIHE
jgi:hypothetical protein